MRGDGSDGRRGDGHVDASDLDTLDEPAAPLDPVEEYDEEYDDGYDDDGYATAAAEPRDATRLEEDVLYEEDDLYEEGDEYDDPYAVQGADVRALHPRRADDLADEVDEIDEIDEIAEIDEVDEVGYDDGYEDGYDDGYEDEYADGYGAYEDAAVAAWPMPVAAPAPIAVATGAPSTAPTIWAPGTAPGAWVPLGRPGFSNPLGSSESLARGRTRRRNLSVFSLAGLTNVLLLAYAVTAALLAAFTAALARRRGALDEVVSATDRADALARSSYLLSVTTWGVVGLLAATVVASMIWSGVAARNHRMLSGGASPSAAMAVLPWAVPLANLVLPLRAVSEVAAGPTGHRSPPAVTLRWWIGWVASMLAVGYAVVAAATTKDGDQADAITRLTLAAVAATACFLYCFSQASVLFRHVSRLQHDLAVELD